MTTRKALGKGLNALLPDHGKIQPRISDILLDQIVRNRYQPRLHFNEASIKELAASIKENGVIQPIIVHKVDDGYELIAGERRFRAARLLGLPSIPAIIKTIQKAEALELAIIENVQREDLNPIEQARAYKLLMDDFGLTQEQVAKKVGKERPTVGNMLRLLKLPEEIQHDIDSGRLTMGHARALLACETEAAMMEMRARIIHLGLNVRDVEARTKKRKAAKSQPAPDPFLRGIIDGVQKKLSTKVSVRQNKKGAGSIIIDFYNPEDLERIVELLSSL